MREIVWDFFVHKLVGLVIETSQLELLPLEEDLDRLQDVMLHKAIKISYLFLSLLDDVIAVCGHGEAGRDVFARLGPLDLYLLKAHLVVFVLQPPLLNILLESANKRLNPLLEQLAGLHICLRL